MKKIVYLFSFIPVGIIEENERKLKFYLFGFLPLIKIKKYKLEDNKNNFFDPYNNKFIINAYKKCKSVGKKLCIRKNCVFFNVNTIIGDYCYFNGCKVYGDGKINFGNYVHSGAELLIITKNHNYDGGEHIPYSSNDYIYKDIEIGDFVWIGRRVTILPGTKIGEGAIIQAGAVVHGEIPPLAIAGGNPAKVFKYRDKEHFEKLKKEGKFN